MRHSVITKFLVAACGRFATVNFASLVLPSASSRLQGIVSKLPYTCCTVRFLLAVRQCKQACIALTGFVGCGPPRGEAAARPLTRGLMLILVSLIALLTACGPKELVRMGFGKVESFRAERVGLGSVEGVATISLYNGNKKNVTFGSGRIDVALNGRTLGVITLQEAVEVRPGFGRTEVPVRIRFAQDGLQSVAELLFPGRRQRGRKPELRIAGSLGITAGNGRQIQNVRFNRKVTEKMIGQLDMQSSLLTEFLR